MCTMLGGNFNCFIIIIIFYYYVTFQWPVNALSYNIIILHYFTYNILFIFGTKLSLLGVEIDVILRANVSNIYKMQLC